ncbi:MAG: hypothetical protein V3S64_09655 [bacterium]
MTRGRIRLELGVGPEKTTIRGGKMARYIEGDLRNMPEDLDYVKSGMDEYLKLYQAGKIKMGLGMRIAFFITLGIAVLFLLALFTAGVGGIVLGIVFWSEVAYFLSEDQETITVYTVVFIISWDFLFVLFIALSWIGSRMMLPQPFKLIRIMYPQSFKLIRMLYWPSWLR